MKFLAMPIIALSLGTALSANGDTLTKRVYKPGDRIAVIGAGAAGLGVVRSLINNGVEPAQITLIEKSAQAGGKVLTTTADGRSFELGAQMIVPGLYQPIQDLLAKYNLTTFPMSRGGVFDVNLGQFQSSGGNDLNVLPELARYTAMYEMSWHVVSDVKGFSQIPPELNVSWPEFVKAQGFDHLAQSLGSLLGGSGFLRPENPPIAAQVVRMLTPYALWCATTHGIYGIQGGYQQLWKLEAADLEKLGVKIQFNSTVTSIRRGTTTTQLQISDAHSEVETTEFNHVFYTGDLAYLPSLVADLSDSERNLYARIKHYDYRSFVLRVQDLPNDHLSGSAGFAPTMYEMPAGRPVLTVKPYTDSSISVFYAYGDKNLTNDQIVGGIKTDLNRFNGTVEEVIASATWNYYFPHVDSDLQGFFNGVMSEEGVGGLWMAGEATSFAATIQVYEQGRDFAGLFVQNKL